MACPPDPDDELAALRREYVEGLRHTLAVLGKTIAAHDHAVMSTIAHQTRGAAGMYGYPDLSATAALLEDAIDEGQSDALILELADEFAHAVQAIVDAG